MDTVKMVPVSSSNMAALGYDPDSQVLTVQFHGKDEKSGRVYQYQNVPAWLYGDMLGSDSVGMFFNQTIRANGQLYPFKVVEPSASGISEEAKSLAQVMVSTHSFVTRNPTAKDLTPALYEREKALYISSIQSLKASLTEIGHRFTMVDSTITTEALHKLHKDFTEMVKAIHLTTRPS